MLRYLLRRLVYMVVTLWLIVTFTFVLMKKFAGGPVWRRLAENDR